MSTTVLESDSSTTTLNLTDSGGSGGGVTNVGVLNTVEGDNKTDSASSSHENVSNLASTSNIGPMGKKVKQRPTPYSKPSILLPADRRQRKKKKITWQPDESLNEVHYFELIPDERTNVSRQLLQIGAANASLNQSQTQKEKEIPERFIHDPHQPGTVVDRQRESELDRRPIRCPKWRLILIDLPAELPSPGWNSQERSAQAERETYVLGAIDLPGQPSTIDEPDTLPMTTKGHAKVIPFDNIDGMYTEYPDVYKFDLVNGIGGPRNSKTYMENFLASQKSQLLSDQVQDQLINVTQSPFVQQNMNVKYQQQLLTPFATHQQPFQPSAVQTQTLPTPLPGNLQSDMTMLSQYQPQRERILHNRQPPRHRQHQRQQEQQQKQQPLQQQQQQMIQQPQQQPGVPGPIMPWLNYPFNNASENPHAHLFRRPAT